MYTFQTAMWKHCIIWKIDIGYTLARARRAVSCQKCPTQFSFLSPSVQSHRFIPG